MPDFTHGFTIDASKCKGCLACMRACPTKAVRVHDGKASLLPYLCVDCGSCLRVCSSGAIKPTTLSFAELDKFKFKVAVPSPVLFGQFPMAVSCDHLVEGLKSIGFDAVWDYEVELALINRATSEYIEKWQGPFPLISNTCPVVVRLIQVSYPEMVDQVLQIQPPRELAGRDLKQNYAREHGISPDEIAAVYITPCQAKTISILEPAEQTKSHLDGALGISEVYNDVLVAARALRKKEKAPSKGPGCKTGMVRWATSRWLCPELSRHRSMYVSGLSNIIQVFNDIEKGKLRNIDYIECWTCWDGCIGGNLTVDDVYITRSKINRLQAELPAYDPDLEKKVKLRFPNEDFALKGRLRTRNRGDRAYDLKEQVKRIKNEEAVLKALPSLDCGLCGAPTCKSLAEDVARGDAKQSDCVFYSNERLKQLRKIYMHNH
ncbi:MAG TPA: [Fe-Fe] hydrogenase large subunit C-terminal domain-containing protein [Acidobacteriota bacterium]|nr:[Fe-Fe] hydrogenase large subunit C-terminal domain-containing protein [Acidobacteriota bacterium]